MFGLSRRDRMFYDLFGSQARVCREAAVALQEAIATLTDLPARSDRIKSLEHQGDDITHRIFSETARVFVTPFDREDMHGLASSLDDVLDNIDAAAAKLALFRITEPIPSALKLAEVLADQTRILEETVPRIAERSHMLEACIRIHALENEGDRALHEALTAMFEAPKDPILLIKQKEIVETIEAATDRCEDVANVLESLMLKSA
jgi:predicted phosphate transport protein (TIGR00153 family)